MEELIQVEYRGPVAIVTMNSLPLNLLGRGLLNALRKTFIELEKNKDLRAIILRSGIEKAFSAGADAKHFGDFDPGVNGEWGRGIFNIIDGMPVPVIACINGYCYGGGMELALACDFRYVAEDASMGLTEANLGLIPAWGGAARLPWLIGEANAKMLFFTAARISGQEALQYGVAQKCVPADQLLDSALELANLIATKAPKSIAAVKNVFRAERQAIYGAGMLAEAVESRICTASEDTKEGLAALREKRAPQFKNK